LSLKIAHFVCGDGFEIKTEGDRDRDSRANGLVYLHPFGTIGRSPYLRVTVTILSHSKTKRKQRLKPELLRTGKYSCAAQSYCYPQA
jgi:hypothetical protein